MSAVAVFDVVGTRPAVRAAVFEGGEVVRVSPEDAMAVWPVQHVSAMVIEEYAPAPAEMQLRVHTSCNRVMRLRGEVSSDALFTLLQIESALTLG